MMKGRRSGLWVLMALWMAVALFVIGRNSLLVLPDTWRALTAVFRSSPPSVIHLLAHWLILAGTLVAGVALVVGCAGTGNASLRWVSARVPSGWLERTGTRMLVGIGVCATVAYALGVLGLVFPVTAGGLWGLMLLPALGVRRARLAAEELRKAWSRDRLAWGLSLVLGIPLFLSAMAPEVTVDALSYHLAVPEHTRLIHKLSDMPHLQFRWPLLAERMIAMFPSGVTPHLLNIVAFSAMGILTYGWLDRRWGKIAAICGLASLFVIDDVATLVPIVKPDVLAVAFTLLAAVLWDRMVLERGRPRGAAAMLLGVALGWAFCTKFTAVVVAVGLFAWHAGFDRRTLASRTAIGALTGFLAAGAPFLARTWLLTGNPVYPFGGGGLHWNELNDFFMRHEWPEPEFDRASVSDVAGLLVRAGTDQVPLAWVGIPLLLSATGGFRAVGHLVFAAIVAAVAAIWVFGAPFLRFLTPVYPLLIAAGSSGVSRAAAWPKKIRVVAAVTGVAVLALKYQAVVTAVNAAGGEMKKHVVPVALGLERGDSFRARMLTTYWQAVESVRESGAGAGKVLLAGDSRGALFSRWRVTISQDPADYPLILRFCRESRSPDEIRKRFRQAGILMIASNYLNSVHHVIRTTSDYWRPEEVKRCYEFAVRWLEPLGCGDAYDFQNGGWEFFRVREKAGRLSRNLVFLPGTEGFTASRSEDGRATTERLQRLVAAAPRVASFQCALAAFFMESGRWVDALVHFERGLEDGCPTAAPYAQYGRVLFRVERYAEAGAAFQEALEREPGNVSYRRWMERSRMGVRGGEAR